jgi:hypothetical protein
MLCGLLIGLLVMPARVAHAQWPVFDAAAYTHRIKSEIKRVQEWAERVRQYQTMYTNVVNQLTTLRGVLQTVDKQLAKNMELARLTNDIGEIIRGSFKLKRQIENQTRYQIAALQRIDDRLNNGIFDPEQDLQDFEDYLMYSMGRNSKQTIRMAVRTAQADAQLNKWMTEKQEADKDLSDARKAEAELVARLEREKNNPDPFVIQPLTDALQKNQLLIESLSKKITDLEEKIQQRMNLYGVRLSDMENFAYQVQSAKVAWLELQKTKQEINKAFDAAVVGMKDSP